MGKAPAIKLAIDLLHFPSQVRSLRLGPLPDDVLTLVRIVAGDEETTRGVAESAGRSRDLVREAAAFFVEQILLDPKSDSYRVLGSKPDAPYHDLRRNMALLLRWLHPDADRLSQRAVFATRVTRAWNDLKSQERRAAYDRRIAMAAKSQHQTRRAARTKTSSTRRWAYVEPSEWDVDSRKSLHSYITEKRGLLRRMLLLLTGRGTL